MDSVTKDGEAWLGKTANLQKIRIPREQHQLHSQNSPIDLQPGMYIACLVAGSQGGTLLGKVLHRTSTKDFVGQFGSVVPEIQQVNTMDQYQHFADIAAVQEQRQLA